MTYQTEFPDFPASDMPPLPEGFTDSSWHNDACPSITNEALRMLVYIDYSDIEKREEQGDEDCPRFIVHPLDAEGCFIPDEKELLLTDKWDDVLDLIARRKADGV